MYSTVSAEYPLSATLGGANNAFLNPQSLKLDNAVDDTVRCETGFSLKLSMIFINRESLNRLVLSWLAEFETLHLCLAHNT